MNISDAINLLRDAELKQLAIKDDKKAVLGFINLGVLELYKRFNLWEKGFSLVQAAGKTLYLLDGTDPDLDIDLSDHQFLMIEQLFDEEGIPVVLKNRKEAGSVHTPKYNELDFLESVAGLGYTGVYRAAPLFLTHEKQEVPLPPQFFEALFNYVGYRGHGSVKGDIKSENNTHYIRFEASCDRVEFEGLFIQDDLTSDKFEARGFV